MGRGIYESHVYESHVLQSPAASDARIEERDSCQDGCSAPTSTEASSTHPPFVRTPLYEAARPDSAHDAPMEEEGRPSHLRARASCSRGHNRFANAPDLDGVASGRLPSRARRFAAIPPTGAGRFLSTSPLQHECSHPPSGDRCLRCARPHQPLRRRPDSDSTAPVGRVFGQPVEMRVRADPASIHSRLREVLSASQRQSLGPSSSPQYSSWSRFFRRLSRNGPGNRNPPRFSRSTAARRRCPMYPPRSAPLSPPW